MSKASCQTEQKSQSHPWILQSIDTAAGPVPQILTDYCRRDRLGAWKVRWKIGRMHYVVPPGLYAVNTPEAQSPVLVTANFKLSFDSLRRELKRHKAWILVLDTKGINVWCAAGKGTFGTWELIHRINESKLKDIVAHRELILPQLGAPGITAKSIVAGTGFKVRFGPVYAKDLPAYLDSGKHATAEMRQVKFPFLFRLALAPVELLTALKYGLPAMLLIIVAAGISRDGYEITRSLSAGTISAVMLLLGIIAGSIVTPALLPWLPGRAFAVKGLMAGVLLLAAACVIAPCIFIKTIGTLATAGMLLLAVAVASFMGMNFTGSSTYTSLSGVRREMRLAVPLQVAAVVIGSVLWLIGRFV